MAGSEEEEGLLNLSTMAGIEASQVKKEEVNFFSIVFPRSLSATWEGCKC